MNRHPLAGSLPHLSPDANLLILTLGVLLIYLELNRPGRVLPGALGLLLTLLSLHALNPTPAAFLLLTTAAALLILDLLRPVPVLVDAAATLALTLGFHRLAGTHLTAVLLCGITLGAGTSLLARIARRARANKALD